MGLAPEIKLMMMMMMMIVCINSISVFCLRLCRPYGILCTPSYIRRSPRVHWWVVRESTSAAGTPISRTFHRGSVVLVVHVAGRSTSDQLRRDNSQPPATQQLQTTRWPAWRTIRVYVPSNCCKLHVELLHI